VIREPRRLLRRVILLLGLVFFGLFLRKIELDDLRNIQFLTAKFVVAIIAINVFVLLLKTWRWHFLLSRFHIRLSQGALFRSVASGFSLGLVSPGTTGEFARILKLPVEPRYAVSTTLFEKVTDIGVLAYLSFMGIFFLAFPSAGLALSLVVPLLLVAGLSFAVVRSGVIRNAMSRMVIKSLRLDAIELGSIFSTLKSTRVVFVSILVSLLLWIAPGIQYYMICRALNIQISFQGLVMSFYGPYLLGVISMIPLGFGVFDLGASRMLVRSLNEASGLADVSIILFRSLSTLPLVLFGLTCFLYTMMRKNPKEST
jgi:uncharacterized protein (TIRG00374 family)